MKIFLLSCIFLFSVCNVFAGSEDTLYSHAFGNKRNPAVIYLHNLPGGNAVAFEYTSAQMLADSGFYVIVYDQRGSIRSKQDDSVYRFTIDESLEGLDTIYRRYHLQKATFLCHGGAALLAAKFANRYPQKVNKIILVSAPLQFGNYYKNMFDACYKNYTNKSYSYGIYLLDSIAKMDTCSAQYAYNCIQNALFAELYAPHYFTDSAIALYNKIGSIKNVTQPDPFVFKYFYANNKMASINIVDDLKKNVAKKIPVYAIYGKDDGTCSKSNLDIMQSIAGKKHVVFIDDAGYNVYMDQREIFIHTVLRFLK